MCVMLISMAWLVPCHFRVEKAMLEGVFSAWKTVTSLSLGIIERLAEVIRHFRFTRGWDSCHGEGGQVIFYI